MCIYFSSFLYYKIFTFYIIKLSNIFKNNEEDIEDIIGYIFYVSLLNSYIIIKLKKFYVFVQNLYV